MIREDIIRMAREAGFYVDEKARQNQPNCISHTYHMIDNQLERFAALVAASEREACARVCVKLYDKFSDDPDMVRLKARHAFVLDGCAAAIRARGQA